jgi:RNase P subunit RPR2
MEVKMKFCKDCKHFLASEKQCNTLIGSELLYSEVAVYRCESSKRPYDLVMGVQKQITAQHCRNLAITGCGEEARWFEPIVEDADLDDLSTIPFGK